MLSFTKNEWEKRVKKGNLPDVVKINGIIYTMDCYDMNGEKLSYGNKKLFAGFTIHTKDRYKKGFKDAKIVYYPKGEFVIRNDIEYYE